MSSPEEASGLTVEVLFKEGSRKGRLHRPKSHTPFSVHFTVSCEAPNRPKHELHNVAQSTLQKQHFLQVKVLPNDARFAYSRYMHHQYLRPRQLTVQLALHESSFHAIHVLASASQRSPSPRRLHTCAMRCPSSWNKSASL